MDGAPDDDLARELHACMASGADIWIFAYGSLMWDPGFSYADAQPALLRGYHRSFCVYSSRNRGTPVCPGLVLGLDRGGACKGIAFRVPAADVPAALRYLWAREMGGRTYHIKRVPLRIAEGAIEGRAFVVDRKHRNYAGALSLDETARFIIQGVGSRGACRHYLENTVCELRKLGQLDGPLHRLEARVQALLAAAGASAVNGGLS